MKPNLPACLPTPSACANTKMLEVTEHVLTGNLVVGEQSLGKEEFLQSHPKSAQQKCTTTADQKRSKLRISYRQNLNTACSALLHLESPRGQTHWQVAISKNLKLNVKANISPSRCDQLLFALYFQSPSSSSL